MKFYELKLMTKYPVGVDMDLENFLVQFLEDLRKAKATKTEDKLGYEHNEEVQKLSDEICAYADKIENLELKIETQDYDMMAHLIYAEKASTIIKGVKVHGLKDGVTIDTIKSEMQHVLDSIKKIEGEKNGEN